MEGYQSKPPTQYVIVAFSNFFFFCGRAYKMTEKYPLVTTIIFNYACFRTVSLLRWRRIVELLINDLLESICPLCCNRYRPKFWNLFSVKGSWCPGRDSSPESLEYKQQDLPLHQFDGFRERNINRI